MSRARVRVYTVPDCIDCAAVMYLLEEADIPFEEVDISTTPKAREALAMLSGGLMSMPQVYVNNIFIGQVAEVRHLVRTGRLQKQLEQGG